MFRLAPWLRSTPASRSFAMISCGACRFLFIESSCPFGLSDSHINWYNGRAPSERGSAALCSGQLETTGGSGSCHPRRRKNGFPRLNSFIKSTGSSSPNNGKEGTFHLPVLLFSGSRAYEAAGIHVSLSLVLVEAAAYIPTRSGRRLLGFVVVGFQISQHGTPIPGCAFLT